MPKLTGIFEQLRDFESISAQEVNAYLKIKLEPHILENFIANRIIYPQTIPVKEQEMVVDQAILRVFIDKNLAMFYDEKLPKIVIPSDFLVRFGELATVAVIFVDAVKGDRMTQIFIRDNTGNKLIGTLIPLKRDKKSNISITINDQQFNLHPGKIINLPFTDRHLRLKISPSSNETVVAGGDLGLIFDLKV